MSDNFPPALGSTSNNSERSRHRGDLSFSDFCRSLPGIRTLDGDQYAYCPSCSEFLWFAEVTTAPHKSWTMTQKLARKCDSYALLVTHEQGDTTHEGPVSFHHIGPKSPMCWEDETTWQRLYEFLDSLTAAHRCSFTKS